MNVVKGTVALLLVSAAAAHAEVSVKNEVKVEQKVAAAQNVGGAPVGDAAAFRDGKLYYNAMPSTPAAGTAVKVIDSKDDTDFIVKVYKLKTRGISAELASYIRTTVNKEQGEVNVSVNTKTGDEYIVVTAPIFQFEYVESLIEALDQDGVKFYEDGTSIGTYKLKNRLASEVNTLISDVLKSRDGLSYADDRVNKVYLIDDPSYFDATLHYVAEFDVPPEMVRIEAQIVEIENDNDFNFGLALEAWKEGLPENVDMQLDLAQSKGRADLNMSPDSWARYAAQSVYIQGMRPKAMANIINYLVRTGHAKLLSSPTVVAVNGQEANIASLDYVNYKAYNTPDQPLNKQAATGVSLTIRPVIGAETIQLEIDAAVNSLVGWGSGNDPIINTRTTTANAVLRDGELFTLSGLRKDAIAKEDERVPVLGAMPLVGYLFRHEIDVKKTSEIVVFLTPRKVTPSQGVMEKERQILESTTAAVNEPPQGAADTFVDRVILNRK